MDGENQMVDFENWMMLDRYRKSMRESQQVAGSGRRWRNLLLVALLLVTSACSTQSFVGRDISGETFLNRASTQTTDGVSVRAVVLDSSETLDLIGIDLYEQGIQPVWLEVSNDSELAMRTSLWSIDRDYFSPIEVAYMNKGLFSSSDYSKLERWLYANALTRHVPPNESRSGLVFTNLKPGTKGLNVDILSREGLKSFTFFLAMPGFSPDYMRVDFAQIYGSAELVELDRSGFLDKVNQELGCCASDASGEMAGGPLNIVFIGSPRALRRSFMRGGWLETSQQTQSEIASKQHYFRGRVPDGRFYQDRADGEERVLMNIWLAPWRVNGQSSWVAQTYYHHKNLPIIEFLKDNEQFQSSELLAKFAGESISADIDSAKLFVVQNLWYNQSVNQLGFVSGITPSTAEEPGETFDGYGYFTTGSRAVIHLSEVPVSMSDTVIHSHAGKLEDKNSVGLQ